MKEIKGSGRSKNFIESLRKNGELKSVDGKTTNGKKTKYDYFTRDSINYLIIHGKAKKGEVGGYDSFYAFTDIDDIKLVANSTTKNKELYESMPSFIDSRIDINSITLKTFHSQNKHWIEEKKNEKSDESFEEFEEKKQKELPGLDSLVEDEMKKLSKGKEKKDESEEEQEAMIEPEYEEVPQSSDDSDKSKNPEVEKDKPVTQAEKNLLLKNADEIVKQLHNGIVTNKKDMELIAHTIDGGLKQLIEKLGNNQLIQVDVKDTNPIILGASQLALTSDGKLVKKEFAEIIDQYGEIEKIAQQISKLDKEKDTEKIHKLQQEMNEKVKEVVRKAKDLSTNKKNVKMGSKSEIAKRIHQIRV
jgi:hypothetical protein